MKYGVIDIGSNTIRTVVYEVEDGGFRQLLNEKDFSGVIGYVKDGELAEAGIDKIISVLSEMGALCRLSGCEDILCFATASLRGVKDIGGILPRIEAESGLRVRLISGEDEARYDYLGLRCCVRDESGVGMDLGGGSCQIFRYGPEGLAEAASIPCGSLVLYNACVKGVIPGEKEIKAIRRRVKGELKALPGLAKLGFPTLYAMGGTARAAAKLHRAMAGGGEPAEGCRLTVEQLGELQHIVEDLGVQGTRLLSQVVPERLTTILPGIAAIRAVCKYVGASQIEVIKYGVREGYLWENILGQRRP